MIGVIDRTNVPGAHYCELPEIYDSDNSERRGEFDLPRIWLVNPIGTVFICDDCGAGYVLYEAKDEHYARVAIVGGPRWRRETARERRQREGIPRWAFWM